MGVQRKSYQIDKQYFIKIWTEDECWPRVEHSDPFLHNRTSIYKCSNQSMSYMNKQYMHISCTILRNSLGRYENPNEVSSKRMLCSLKAKQIPKHKCLEL